VIAAQVLRSLARQWNLSLDVVEKHYMLGWILYGISKTSVAKSLAFKGGTSLSKIYFPSYWRVSEDLDFTVLGSLNFDDAIKTFDEEVAAVLGETGRITLRRRENPYTNKGYLQYKMGYTGPVGSGMVKIEVSREKFVGETGTRSVPNVPAEFDYPEFAVMTYALETVVGEKGRAVIERGYIRDYYDLWRLLKEKKFDLRKARQAFYEKCKAKGVDFVDIAQFFPDGIAETLRPHLKSGLARLSREPLPAIEEILGDLRWSLQGFLP